MYKKYFIFILLLLMVAIISEPNPLTGFVGSQTSYYTEEEYKVNSIYNVGFNANKNYYGYINVYQPTFNPINYQLAHYYSYLFKIQEKFIETNEYYAFYEDNKSLYVYKLINLVKYQDNNINFNNKEQISKSTAILKAEEFFEKSSLNLAYEETFVEYKDGYYYISFIERFNNLKNFGFYNKVVMDSYGNILNVEYYYNSYENIGAFKIMSVNEAFYKLPVDMDTNEEIYLNNVQLVYIYENSILQPAYFFKGKFEDGRVYKTFVKAAIYK